MAAEHARHAAEVEADGYTIVRGAVPAEVVAAARAMMDEILGPAGSAEAPMEDGDGRKYQQRPWPRLSAAQGGGPVVNYVRAVGEGGGPGTTRQVEHPIRDTRAAACFPPMVPAVAAVLRCKDPASELCLVHQNFRRTDPSPPPYPSFSADDSGGQPMVGLHMDQAFLPEHYKTSPKQSYVLTLLALSPMVKGGAAFCVAPGSFAAAKQAGEALPAAAAADLNAYECWGGGVLPGLLGQGQEGSAVEASRAAVRQVEMAAGDLLIFDPMLSHAGSPFRAGVRHATGVSRHALFSVFAPRAAFGTSLAGIPARAYSAPASKYPEVFCKSVPLELRGMLDWQLPIVQPRL
eukprot:SAG22_NODE_561_length_9080_cov_2.242623_2_plen_348_part_00